MRRFFRLPGCIALLCCLLLALALQLLPNGFQQLSFQRHLIEQGQWWRVITGSWVQLGFWHLLLNSAGLVVIALLCPDALKGYRIPVVLIVASLGCGLGLLFFSPHISWYCGLSGAIHGVWSFALLVNISREPKFSTMVFTGLVAKLLWEHLAGSSSATEQLIGAPVVVSAHLYGALSGLGCYLFWVLWNRANSSFH